MAKIVGIAGVVTAVCLFWQASTAAILASDPPTMRLDPASLKVQGDAGTTFTLAVRIEGVSDLHGFEFELQFDGAVFGVVEIREGPFLASAGATTCNMAGPPLFENQVRLACVLKGGPPGASGSGVVGEIDFSLPEPYTGLGQFLLTGCQAADSSGDPIALNGCKDAEVALNPTPTARPPSLGGVAAYPDVPSGSSASLVASTVAAVTAAAVALGGAAWYARRRLQ